MNRSDGACEAQASWRLTRAERISLAVALLVAIVFGVVLERRTALRTEPMGDLGVFARAAWAVRSGENLYTVDWRSWHYHYPPLMAILMTPLAHPPLDPAPPKKLRTRQNTPWGYHVNGPTQYYPLGRANIRFFFIVATWCGINILLLLASLHALGCSLEGRAFRDGPPRDEKDRRRWWTLRTIPALLCAGSIGTEFSVGQVDLVMVCAFAFAVYFAGRRRDWSGGICLSFPACVKLFPPLFLAYPFWRRRWRMVAATVAGLILALAIVPAIALGPTRTVTLYKTWFRVLALPAVGESNDGSRTKELLGMNNTDNQSLLAFIHNCTYFDMPTEQRPIEASPFTRKAVYAFGGVLLLGILAADRRRHDTPRSRAIFVGLLTALTLVLSPVTHGFYFITLLPLLAGLADRWMSKCTPASERTILALILGLFMFADIFRQIPPISDFMKDLGLPLLILLALMAVGALVLEREGALEITVTEIEQKEPSACSWRELRARH